MDPEVIKGLFEQGLMSIETDPELGGAGGSFTAAIIVIEELAKVDPSVSVLCDVHNTLVNTVMRKYASKHLQEKYMPSLATDKVSQRLAVARSDVACAQLLVLHPPRRSWVPSVFPSPLQAQTPSP